MQTLERTVTIRSDLAQRADRKMRRYGMSFNDAVEWACMLIVTQRGLPDFATPINLDFHVDGIHMRKRRGVYLPIEAEDSDGMHTARAERIGLDAFAETKAELAAEVSAQLAMLWKEYAMADDAKLTESAQEVKKNLLATFEEVRDA